MRLVLITKKEIIVYEGRKFLVAFEYQPLSKEDIEYVRTDIYQQA
jgi:hypothetical protein